jgi:hypothetical protein
VLRCTITAREDAGRLEHDIHTQRLPRKLCRILDRQNLEFVLVDGDGVGAGFDVRLQVAEDGVVLQQMGQRRSVGQIVDRDDIYAAVVHSGAHDVAADTAEPVDPDFDGHLTSPLSYCETIDFNEPLAWWSTPD